MSENNKDHQMDALLDSLLSAYAAVEPRPGLEVRIRARLNAHSARRRTAWMLALAVSAATVFLAALIATRQGRVVTPTEAVQHKATPEPSAVVAKQAPALPPRSASVRLKTARNKTQALLQLTDAMHSSDALIFQRAQSYVAPAQPHEASPEQQTAEQQPTGDKINVQNLGVESIDIKQLAPSGNDEKGNL
jgi:hypothetical protein